MSHLIGKRIGADAGDGGQIGQDFLDLMHRQVFRVQRVPGVRGCSLVRSRSRPTAAASILQDSV